MKILAFAASSSSQSINKQLVAHAAEVLKAQAEGIETEVIDINDYEMPLYSSDRENELGKPQQAQDFFAKIGAADAVIISFAEHNGSYTAAYKNLFDWTSRIDTKVFQGKPVVYLATSPGPGGANSVLTSAVGSAPFFGANVKASLSVPSFYDVYDADAKAISNEQVSRELKEAVGSLL